MTGSSAADLRVTGQTKFKSVCRRLTKEANAIVIDDMRCGFQRINCPIFERQQKRGIRRAISIGNDNELGTCTLHGDTFEIHQRSSALIFRSFKLRFENISCSVRLLKCSVSIWAYEAMGWV